MPAPKSCNHPPLLIPVGCDFCPECSDTKLYAVVDGNRLCFGCWNSLGRPYCTASNLTPETQAAMEAKIRERMLKRGGADRHLVRKGRT